MRARTIDDVEERLRVLQDEIRRSAEARCDHRLHGVLLVAQGMSAPQVAQFLGDGTRTVEYWVKRFNKEGLSGLVEGQRPGRPARLAEAQLEQIGVILRESPPSFRMWVLEKVRHKASREEAMPRFRLNFCPSYSPDLNPIEPLWKLTRRSCLHNVCFPKLDQLGESAVRTVRSMDRWKQCASKRTMRHRVYTQSVLSPRIFLWINFPRRSGIRAALLATRYRIDHPADDPGRPS